MKKLNTMISYIIIVFNRVPFFLNNDASISYDINHRIEFIFLYYYNKPSNETIQANDSKLMMKYTEQEATNYLNLHVTIWLSGYEITSH